MNRKENVVISSIYKTYKLLNIGEYTARNREWAVWAYHHGLHTIEYLLPRIHQQCSTELPQYMRANPSFEESELKKRVEELGPWTVPFRLTPNLSTMNRQENVENMIYRSHLLCDTVEQLLGKKLGETTILDMATRNGYFALDMAYRGTKHVHGVELREKSIRQAEFLREYYSIDNISFEVSNIFDIPDKKYDVVFNFGLLYHVNNPLHLMQQTYDLCKEFAVVDTGARLEPTQAFFLVTDQEPDNPAMGEVSVELHPSYRAVIALMQQVGFKNMIEVTGESAIPHRLYATGHRRCIIGYK